MRHHYDLMNAQNWNTDLKKPPMPDIDDLELHKGIKPYDEAVPKLDSSSVVRVPLTLDPLSVQHIPGIESPVKEPVRKSTRTGMTGENPSDEITDKSNTEEIRSTHPKASAVNHRSLKTRKKSYNKLLFISSGLLISLVSGVLIYTWLARSENRTFIASLDTSFGIGEAVSESVPTDTGEIEEPALLSDDSMGAEFNDDTIGAGAGEPDGYGEGLEDPEDAAAIASADDMPLEMASIPSESGSADTGALALIADSMAADTEEVLSEQNEPSSVPGESAVLKSQDRTDTTPVKEKLPVLNKQSAAIPKADKDVIPERKVIAQENTMGIIDRQSAVTVMQPPVEKAAALLLGNAETEKVLSLSQSPAIKSDDSGNNSPALAAVAQAGEKISAKADSTEQKTTQKSMSPSTVKEPALNRTITAESVSTGQISFSKEFFEEDKTGTSTGPEEAASATRGKVQPASDTGNDRVLQTGLPAIEQWNSEKHKSASAALLLSSREIIKPVSPADVPTRMQADVPEKEDKKTVQPTPAVYEAIERTGSSTKARNAAMVQNKSSDPQVNAHNVQSSTVALKQMSVTYEDQFDTHTNNWPEYNNSTASVLIEDGEYNIEHKGKTGSHIVLHPYGVSNDMDYMIYIDINSVRGAGRNSYGFVFGGKDIDNNYSFQISSDNQYSIQKMQGGKSRKLAGGQIDNVFIGENSEKTMKIVKQRNKVRFYVDDYYVDELTDVELPGDKVGFYVEGKVKISVDSTRTEIRFSGK